MFKQLASTPLFLILSLFFSSLSLSFYHLSLFRPVSLYTPSVSNIPPSSLSIFLVYFLFKVFPHYFLLYLFSCLLYCLSCFLFYLSSHIYLSFLFSPLYPLCSLLSPHFSPRYFLISFLILPLYLSSPCSLKIFNTLQQKFL